MQKPQLSLDYYFVARSIVIAAPIEEPSTPGSPEVDIEAYLRTREELVCVVKVKWGIKGTTEYFIDIEMHGSFNVNLNDMTGYPAEMPPRLLYASYGVNAAQIVYSTIRSHIAALTAAGPHMSWFLPTTIIDASDVKLSVSDDLAGLLDPKPSKTKARKKPVKKKPASK